MSLNTYLNLVTSEHFDKPKFIETISVSLKPLVDIQTSVLNFPVDYNVDTAIGAQLDVIGQWVGRSRQVKIPLTDVYFSFDTSIATGWDAGIWKSQFDPDSGLTSLPDEQYRILIKAKIAANKWDGTTPGAYLAWKEAFGEASQIVIQDNQNMSIIMAIFGLPSDTVFFKLLVEGYIPLKPEGVRILSYNIAPDTGPIFAWDCSSEVLKGFDESSWPIELTSV